MCKVIIGIIVRFRMHVIMYSSYGLFYIGLACVW